MSSQRHSRFVDTLEKGMHYLGEVLADTEYIRRSDVDGLSIAHKITAPVNTGLLQTPIEHVDDRRADFHIYRNISDRYRDEFTEHLPSLSKQETEKLNVIFSTGMALGGLAIKRTMQNPRKARSPKRLREIMDLFGDTNDFQSTLIDEFGSDEKSSVLRNMLDRHTNQINGMRAALSIVQIALQTRDGIDPISQESVRLCQDSFLEYVRLDGDKYKEIATDGFHKSGQYGIDVFSYAIPEWLIVLAFPMNREKVDSIF